MGTVLLLASAGVRGRRRGWLGAILLLGLVLGVSGALLAGARRTDTAYRRFSQRFAASDLLIADSNDFGFTRTLDLDEVAALDQVEVSARATALLPVVETDSGPIFAATLGVNPFAPHDRLLGTTIDEFKVVRGRVADPDDPTEAVIGFDPAERTGIDVGDHLSLRIPTRESIPLALLSFLTSLTGHVEAGTTPDLVEFLDTIDTIDLEVDVVGVVATAGGFPPLPGNVQGILYLSPAVYERYGVALGGQDIEFLRLQPGADRDRFLADVNDLDRDRAVAVLASDENDANVARSFHLQARVLLLLGGVMGGAGALVAVQAFGRLLQAGAGTRRIAGHLGATRRDLRRTTVATATLATAGGVGVGIVVAIGLSPLFPLELARIAEPRPGIDVDLAVLGIIAGTGALVALLAAMAAGIQPADSPTPARRANRLPLTTRLALALGAGSRSSRRSSVAAIGAVALATVVAVAAATFGWSMGHLRDTPSAFGWTADVQVGQHGLPEITPPIVAGLVTRNDVAGISHGTVVRFDVGGVAVDVLALEPVGAGGVPARMLEGREPENTDEIALGTVTLDAVGARVGDRAVVTLGSTSRAMTIVGRAVFSKLGDAGQLGRGGLIVFPALSAFGANAPHNILLVTFRGDPCCRAQAARLRASVSPLPTFLPAAPSELGGVGRADEVPWLAGAFVGLFAIAVLAHTLLVTARHQRRTMTILVGLGLTRSELRWVKVQQAASTVLVGLVLGGAAGVVLARLAWRWFTRDIGVEIAITLQPGWLLGSGLGCVLLAGLLAALLAHTTPSRGWITALRPE